MSNIKKRGKNIKLTKYEQDIEDNLDKIEPLSAAEEAKKIAKLKIAAKNYFKDKLKNEQKKRKKISIDVYENDLTRLKKIANEKGLPYQTLVTNVLHKFTTGRLVAKERDKH